jgi:methyl-accepting chemotaxis protein
VTQQNAALVEQAAAAAEAMQDQANALSVAVSVFKLDGARGGARTVAAKPAIVPPVAPAKTVPRKQRKLIKTKENKDGDWKEF